jgi:putative acetyltransferase
MSLTIAAESPLSPEGRALVAESQAALEQVYPPEDIFSLDADGLARPGVTFLVARAAAGIGGRGRALGCAALVDCGGYGEVKRLFVRPEARGRGVAKALMAAIEARAAAAGLRTVRLETGERLQPAVALYRALGYAPRGPFGAYAPHPASLFLEKRLP